MTPDRFFSLVLALQSREMVTTADLAAQVGVSMRTVVRDLQWLQEAGFPVLVQRGRWGGVSLLPGGALDTARLTPAERDHLTLQGLDDQQQDRLGAGAEGRRARQKVAARAPADQLPLSAVVTTDNRPWFGWSADEGTEPSELIGDVRRGVRLRLRYRRSADVEPSWLLVDPYGLLAKAGRWYLVADRSGVPRLFSLERLAEWQPTRAPRRLRPGATLAGVAAELTAGWEAAGTVHIHAELDARQLDRARRVLGSRLAVRSVEGDTATITVVCRGIEGVRQLLPFGDAVTVLDPPEARERIRELALRMLAQYS